MALIATQAGRWVIWSVPGAFKVCPRGIFVFCVHTCVGPPACVPAHPVCVSVHTLSVCLCLPPLCLCLAMHTCTASWACPMGLQGIVGRGPAWRPLQRPEAAFRGGRTLTRGPSLQLEQAVRRESGEPGAQEPRGLALQSVELRRQLQEEQASYRRKLQAYQEGQQRQAQLVQRLQAKVGPPPCSPHPSPPNPNRRS